MGIAQAEKLLVKISRIVFHTYLSSQNRMQDVMDAVTAAGLDCSLDHIGLPAANLQVILSMDRDLIGGLLRMEL